MTRLTDPSVLHTDARLIAVDKPAGEPVIAERGGAAEACLWRRLEARLGSRLYVVHRIDREISGIVVFARTSNAHRELSRAFEDRRVEKRYVAFTVGALEPPSGSIDLELHDARNGKSRPATPGEVGSRAARTDYAVERCWAAAGVVIARIATSPQTGRRHQIRVHLRAAGAPILGDRLYGRRVELGPFLGLPCPRLALHSSRIVLPATAGGGAVEIDSPLPGDLVELERWLDARD